MKPCKPFKPLTDRQRDILAVITAFRIIRGRPPTMRELADAMEPPLSLTRIAQHLKAMQAAGYLTWERYRHGTLAMLAPKPN